jgi:hypothetical protein
MMRWVRWVGVLPAAILASVAIESIPEIALMMVALVRQEAADLIHVAQWLSLPFYVAKEAVFVIAGAKVAPQGRVAAAIVLATMRLPLSLATHVLLQAHRGTTNDLHLALESIDGRPPRRGVHRPLGTGPCAAAPRVCVPSR